MKESDIDKINVRCQQKRQMPNQETKDSGWRFDKIDTMSICFYKTTELGGSSCIKSQIQSSIVLINESDDEFCFI